MKTISLIVPCFNEEKTINDFYMKIKEIDSSLSKYHLAIIFINDGSSDETDKIVDSLCHNDPLVKSISLSRNFGKEIALAAGIDFAEGDAVIPMDVDLQDPPELIFEFIEKWEAGYDVVYGVRQTRDGDPFLKKLTAYIFYRVINALSDIPIPKDTGDYRLIDRKVVLTLREMKEKHRFMKGIFSWVGYNQIGIPYARRPRHSGQSKFNVFKLTSLAIEGITSFSIKPLRLATIFGFIISLGAFFYGLFIIIKSVISGIDVPGYPSIIVLILFLGGVQLISIGIIGEYLGKLYDESKIRPLYIIKDKKGF